MVKPRSDGSNSLSGEQPLLDEIERRVSKKLVTRERRTSRRVRRAERRVPCRACEDEISENEVAVMIGSARVHSRCFVCDRCQKKLHIDCEKINK
jgi:hypothetical protein